MSATPEQDAAYQDARQQTAWVRGVLQTLLVSRHEQTAVITKALEGRDIIELFNVGVGDQEPIKGARDRIAVLDQTIAKLTAFGEQYAGIIAGYEYDRIIERGDWKSSAARVRSYRVVREPKLAREPKPAKPERVAKLQILHHTYRPSPTPKPVRLHSEEVDVSLPAEVVEVDRIPSTGMAILVDEIRRRGAATESWAPWERRRIGASRRYEGFRRMRERA